MGALRSLHLFDEQLIDDSVVGLQEDPIGKEEAYLITREINLVNDLWRIIWSSVFVCLRKK